MTTRLLKSGHARVKPVDTGESVLIDSRGPGQSYVYFGISLFFLFFALVGYLSTDDVRDNWPYYVGIGLIAWMLLYVYFSYKIHKSIFLFSHGFIIALLLFHASHLMLHFFQAYDFSSIFTSDIMSEWYEKSAWLLLVSLNCYAIGFSLSRQFNKKRIISKQDYDDKRVLGQSICWWYGIGLLLVSMIMMGWVFASVGSIFAYSRRELFGGVGDTRGFGLFQMFFPTSLVLLNIAASTPSQKLFARVLGIVGMLFILFLGYRSVALFPAFIGFIIWVKLDKKLNKKFVAILLIFLIIAIPAVKTIRSLGAYDTITLTDIRESISASSADEIFLELGAISGIIAYTLKWVPEEEPYRYGKTYLIEILNSIPNIGLNIGQSNRVKGRGQSEEEFIAQLSASDWFIYRYNSWMFETGGGSGYSIIAEPYLNFGIAGVVTFFLILGYYVGRIDSINLIASPMILLFCASIMWPLFKLVRNDFGTLFKPILFLLIVMSFWRVFTFWKNYKTKRNT